jgi:RNA 3'-terminal phosphate cyclase (ATP)
MIEIDGSKGEGGGQMLRTALSLSCATRQSFSIVNIRANRPKPGLAAQHLTAVDAAAKICGAEVKGAALGSKALEFSPKEVIPGDYSLDIGTAGSVSLVVQTIALPLSLTGKRSQVYIKGGTDVRWAPPVDYLRRIFLKQLSKIGPKACVETLHRGYYPKGGGEVRLTVEGGDAINLLSLSGRGDFTGFDIFVASANLPAHVGQRVSEECRSTLAPHGQTRVVVEDWSAKAAGPGVSVLCRASFEKAILGAAGVGEKGLRSEDLAKGICDALLADWKSGATVDVWGADQFLLPMAMGKPGSEYLARELTGHAKTNIEVIEKFMGKAFEVTEEKGLTKVKRT